VDTRLAGLRQHRDGIIWLSGMLERADVVQILSHATVFVCPSRYEPFGLVNLEAMACETAVVASAVGGIPEIIVDGDTGFLVPLDGDLATPINALLADPERARRFGQAGRRRVIEEFAWTAIAARTAAVYAKTGGAP
jgi:starch synthase